MLLCAVFLFFAFFIKNSASLWQHLAAVVDIYGQQWQSAPAVKTFTVSVSYQNGSQQNFGTTITSPSNVCYFVSFNAFLRQKNYLGFKLCAGDVMKQQLLSANFKKL